MERKLQISAFRNIGFENGKSGKEGLVLNHSLKKGEMGDLVILIGANNSGKSNVLDALLAYKNRKITDRDITDLFMDSECREPSLKLSCKTEEESFGLRLFNDGNTFVNYPGSEKTEFVFSGFDHEIDKFALKSEIGHMKTYENNYVTSQYHIFAPLFDRYDINEQTDDKIVNKFLKEYTNALVKILTDNNTMHSSVISNISPSYTKCAYEVKLAHQKWKSEQILKNSLEKLEKAYSDRFGYSFEPQIFYYSEEKISNESLETTYSSLTNSKFILSVLKAINVDASTIINAHSDSVKLRNVGLLKTTERKLNKLLEKVSKNFNKLYCLEDSKYTFEFVLESEKIFFTLFRGDQSITLNYQSTGFKWFFNLYFNLFSSSKLKPGDIVIMDEPATNLHVKGQIELRSFLKEFAMKNDITIVLATHSPFLIDLDFLDELRIVVNKNNVSAIENDFASINIDDPDSLLPVKESLTVENHVLLDPDQNVVFVEGITDYNYLVAMKKVLGYEDLTFLPIKGVGKKGQEEAISKKLIQIRKHNPFLLADGDAAGKAIKKANSDSELKVMILPEIDEKFREIESLFSKEDAIKFGLIDNNGKVVKHNSVSSIFKNNVIKDPSLVSEETKENFKKVFETIID